MQLAASSYPMPGRPGGPGTPGWDQMHTAIYAVTPAKLSDGHEDMLSRIALSMELAPDEAASRIRSVYSHTPAKLSATDEAIVEGAAMLRRGPGDPGSVVEAIYGQTPAGFTGAQEAAVEAVGLLAGIDSTTAGDITRHVWDDASASEPKEQVASNMMAAFIAAGDNPGADWEFRRLVGDMSSVA